MLSELYTIFGSYTKAQEILFLLKDAKEVVRQGFYEKELFQVEPYCKRNKLFLLKSSFKVALADETTYSNKGLRLPASSPQPAMHFIYISKDEKKANLAAYYELTHNHRELGLLLGYPSCCVEYFITNFNENNTNLELPPTNPWTNLSQRNKDIVLLSHFPCSSECQESIEIAKKYFAIVQQVEQKRAQELFNILGK